jgi:AMP-binding enzyme C-terminal domain
VGIGAKTSAFSTPYKNRPLKAEVTQEALVAFCRGQLASFKIPRYTVMLDAFPMTSSGKVQKFKLRVGLDHMKVYTCGKKFLLTSLNRSRPGKSISKANFSPKAQRITVAPRPGESATLIQGVGKNFFPYMSCVM